MPTFGGWLNEKTGMTLWKKTVWCCCKKKEGKCVCLCVSVGENNKRIRERKVESFEMVEMRGQEKWRKGDEEKTSG